MNPAPFRSAYRAGLKADRLAQRVRHVLPARPGWPTVRRPLRSPGRMRPTDGALLPTSGEQLNNARLPEKRDQKIAAIIVSKSRSGQ
ncbi:hypothetical protein P3T25_009355 [Paraburkholderia sp. GAS32]